MANIVSSKFNKCLEVLEAIRLFSMFKENFITKELKAESLSWLCDRYLEWTASPGKLFLCLKLLSMDAVPVVFITN